MPPYVCQYDGQFPFIGIFNHKNIRIVLGSVQVHKNVAVNCIMGSIPTRENENREAVAFGTSFSLITYLILYNR